MGCTLGHARAGSLTRPVYVYVQKGAASALARARAGCIGFTMNQRDRGASQRARIEDQGRRRSSPASKARPRASPPSWSASAMRSAMTVDGTAARSPAGGTCPRYARPASFGLLNRQARLAAPAAEHLSRDSTRVTVPVGGCEVRRRSVQCTAAARRAVDRGSADRFHAEWARADQASRRAPWVRWPLAAASAGVLQAAVRDQVVACRPQHRGGIRAHGPVRRAAVAPAHDRGKRQGLIEDAGPGRWRGLLGAVRVAGLRLGEAAAVQAGGVASCARR